MQTALTATPKKLFHLYRDAFSGLPRDIWYLSLVLMINRSGTMVLTFLPLYLTRHLAFDLIFAGQVLSAYGLGHLAGAFVGGWTVDRLGAIRVQTLALALSGLGFFAYEGTLSRGGILTLTFLVATAAESFRQHSRRTCAPGRWLSTAWP